MSLLYVQLSPERLTVRDPKTGATFAKPPQVAIARAPKERIVGVGLAAHATAEDHSVMVVNPFAHPLMLGSDFTVAEQLLKAAIQRVTRARDLLGRLFAVAPRVIMHPLVDHPVGGWTQIELRARRELALGASACSVQVWLGPALTDQALLPGAFPAEGRFLA